MLDSQIIGRCVELSKGDGEFRLNARGWTGRVEIVDGSDAWVLPVSDGEIGSPASGSGGFRRGDGDVSLRADGDTWSKLLAEVPAPPFTDPWGASFGGFILEIGPITAARHASIRRLVELLRHAANGTDPAPKTVPSTNRNGEHDAAVGRYIHLDIDGVDHRLFYEEAGTGIPMLCQHTAGSDGRQWRHLLEDERITSRFRVIAYDLPYHGKSLPPQGRAWWAEEYRLTTDFAMKVPTMLARTLQLDDPVYIGSSIGGMLALDLARYYPDDYRAVISLEGGLKVDMPGDEEGGVSAADPASHAEMMMMMMASPAPEAYRQETRLHYAQGAPGVFPGDIYFYATDHDLRGEADKIDTAKCAVYLLTGEYDFLTVPLSEEAARQIKGSEYELMKGLGHFPMSEDPDQFARYLLPVLAKIAGTAS